MLGKFSKMGCLALIAAFVAIVIGVILGLPPKATEFLVYAAMIAAVVWAVVKYLARCASEEHERQRQLAMIQERERQSDGAYKKWSQSQILVPHLDGKGLLLQGDEMLFFKEDNVELYEAATQHASTTSGEVTSMGVDLGDGISVGYGDVALTTTHHQWEEKKLKAVGVLYVTSKRLVFVSDMQTRNILWSVVASCASREKYWLCICASGLNASQNFYALGARIYAEAGQIIQNPAALQEHMAISQKKMESKQEPSAMTTRTRCPHCRRILDIPQRVESGRHILCPYCEQKFTYSSEV